MLFPLNPYNRCRGPSTAILEVIPGGYVKTIYAGTISDPWHIASTADIPGTTTNVQDSIMYDVVIPKFRSRSAHGEVFNNPMESIVTSYHASRAPYYRSIISRYGTAPNYYYGGSRYVGDIKIGPKNSTEIGAWYLPPSPSIDVQDLTERAVQNAWANVSINDAWALVQIAESQKTITSLISIFRRVLGILRALRKLQISKLKREISPAALKDRWMELRYSLRPLMYDIKGNLDYFSPDNHENFNRATFRAFSNRFEDETDSTIRTLYEDAAYRLLGTSYASRYVEARAGVLTHLIDDVSLIVRSGVTELSESVWEIIPFSFIIDWFFSVGKLIASWSPNLGLRTLSSWVSVTDTVILSSIVTSGVNIGSFYENILNCSGTYEKVITTRYRLPNPDRPVLPKLEIRLDAKKLLDLAIIVSQLIGFWGKNPRLASEWRI